MPDIIVWDGFYYGRQRMKLYSRCIPNGSLPYESIEATTRMAAKLFEKIPYIPFMPKINNKDNILRRTISNIPGINITENDKIAFRPSEKTEKKLKLLDKAFISPTKENLAEFGFEAPFLEKFLQMNKKFKSPNACVNLLGPFTLSQYLLENADIQLLADKNYRKIVIQSISVKAMWVIDKIREYNPQAEVLIILEEPLMGKFGDVQRQSEIVTLELITTLLTRVIEKIKSYGGIVGIQCMEKCNWQIPINAGADLISFDAYNNPNNLNIIPETIIDFISKGGKICWCIVPVMKESIVKSLNVEYLKTRLLTTFDGLVLAGVPANFVYNSSFVSVQGNLDNLPLIFGEKALILATQLSKKIPVLS